MEMAARSDRPTALLLAAVTLLNFVGCGGGDEVELGTVSGIVTLDGAPLRGVFVNFQPTGGTPSYGITDSQGRFQLSNVAGEGAIVGKHEVFLEEMTAEDAVELVGDLGGRPSRVPQKFQTPFETIEVSSGHNDVMLNLSSAGSSDVPTE